MTTDQIKKYDGKWCNTHVKIAHMIQNEKKKRNRQIENHQTTKQQQQRSMKNTIQYDVQQTQKRKIDRDDANITKLPRSRSPVNHSLKTNMFNVYPSTSMLQPSSQYDSQYHYHPQTPSLPQHMQQQDKNKIESDFYDYLRYGLQFNPQPSQLSSNPQPKPQTQYTVPNFQAPSVQQTSAVNFPFLKMPNPALFGTPASTASRMSMASTSQQIYNNLHLIDHRHHLLPPSLPLGQNLNQTFNQHKHHQADFQKDHQSKTHQSQLKRTPSAHGLSNNNTNSMKNVYSIPDDPSIQFMQHHHSHNQLLQRHVSPLPPPPPLTPLHLQNQFMPQLYNNQKNVLTNFPLPPTMFDPSLSMKSSPQNNSNTTLLFNHISQASS
jgi:hypothetical protein